MQENTIARRAGVTAAALAAALATCSGAWAHAHLSPLVALAQEGQVFTLAVPTEKEGATTTMVELTPPKGFSIDSFFPERGWTRTVRQTGSGEDAVIRQVVWRGGSVPTGEDAVFSFLGSTDGTGRYAFDVRQTYSDGSIVDWTGPESSDAPAPVVEARSSFGGGGGSTLAVAALALGALALAVGVAALLTRPGGRPLA
jgi:uncharacterized protein YcnI